MKYKIGDRVVGGYGTKEGTIIAYTEKEFGENMYKVKWEGWLSGERWEFESMISKINS